MIITFPQMGTMYVTLTSLFKNLGVDVLPPPPITRKTLDLGVKHSPETVCIPFKITLGSFIEALEQGADTIVTCGGVGPCRLGYYGILQKQILMDLGYQFEMIIIEPNIFSVMKSLGTIAPKLSWREIYQAFCLAGAKMNALDDIEHVVNKVRPKEKLRGQVDSIWQQAQDYIDTECSIDGLASYSSAAIEKLQDIERKSEGSSLTVGVVGEIFLVLEPFINQDIIRKLGYMGIEVYKTMSLTDYVRIHLLKKKKYFKPYEHMLSLAKPFLGHYVGGHGIKSIGATIQHAQNNFDGIVHLFPFTCMPEIVAKNILPQVSREFNIPVLSLAFDEQSGEEGVNTRLEAFIDLLMYRQNKKNVEI